MKLLTQRNSPAGLKVAITAQVCGVSLSTEVVVKNEVAVKFPRLPVLEVDADTVLFSSNTAVWYLVAASKKHDSTLEQLEKWLDWEATVLSPHVLQFIAGAVQKKNTETLSQGLVDALNHVSSNLHGKKYLLGNTLSAADVVVWATIYPLCTEKNLSKSFASLSNIVSWFESLKQLPGFQVSKIMDKQGLESCAEAVADVVLPPLPDVQASDEESPITEAEIKAAIEAWTSEPTLKPRNIEHPILPREGERNILITSALPYVNNVPHLGNIIGCVLSADVFARFCRLRNYNTLYVCGTDEYGTATETKALEEGLTPKEVCDKYFVFHDETYKWFGISFDHFGRTTTEKQTQIAQDIFWKLHKNSYLCEDTVEQLLCQTCNRFLADRFVEGTCPLCGYEDARGDQCDKCGKLVNAVELKAPRCKVCRCTPVVKTSQHLFLDLPKVEDKLLSWMDKASTGWTSNARTIAKSWVKEGLKPRCITRDLKWGTPVPLEGFTDKVFYVWFDAPIGYLSITACYTEHWEQWWKNQQQVTHYEFMAKDNVPFHSVVFPCSQLGTHDPYTLVHHLIATEYLNYEDGKFSKSRGVGVFGTDAQKTGIPADVWRFYLLYVRPESQDSTFSWNDLMLKNNTELLNNLGNFINRGLSFLDKNYGGIVPEMHLNPDDEKLLAEINREVAAFVQLLEHVKLRDAIRHIFNISRLGNQLLQTAQPWVLIKGSDEDKKRAGTVIGLCANISCLLSVLVHPYMPNISRTIQQQLNAPEDVNTLESKFYCRIPAGHKIGKPAPLFQKIEQSHIDTLRETFKGRQDQQQQQKRQRAEAAAPSDSQDLAAEVTKQGDIVRQLKTNKAPKPEIDAAVAVLLDLKKKLATAEGKDPAQAAGPQKPQQQQKQQKPEAAAPSDSQDMAAEVTKQGDIVRQLKTNKAPKPEIDAAVAVLLDLKKKLAIAEGKDPAQAAGPQKPQKKKK